MSKTLLLSLFLMIRVVWSAGCSTLTIPTDYLTVDAFRRANQAANWTATAAAHNNCKDSTNLILQRITGLGSSLWFKSLQDATIQLDNDNNGTHRFSILGGAADTLFRINEDSTAKFFGGLTLGGDLRLGPSYVQYRIPYVTGATDGQLAATSNLQYNAGTSTFSTANGTFSGTLGVTGLLTASSGVTLAGGSFAAGKIYTTSGSGLVLAGTTGSTYDFHVVGPSGSDIIRVPTGGTAVTFPGNATIGGTLGVAGDVTVSNATSTGAVIGLTSADVGGVAWKIASGGSAGGAYPTGSLSFRNTTSGNNWMTISSAGAVAVPGTLGVTGAITATAGVITTVSATPRTLIGPSTTSLIVGENGGWTNAIYRIGSGSHAFNIGGTDYLTVSNTATAVTGKITGSDTIVATLGFRAGGTAASNVTWYRTSADMWGSDDSVAISGRFHSSSKITAADTIRAGNGFTAGGVAASNVSLYRSGADMWTTPDSLTVAGKVAVTDSILGSTARFTGKVTHSAAPRFSSVTASQILSVDANKDLTSTATTGSGSVVQATSPTISGPTFTGTIGTALTASRTVVTDGSGNLSVNAESGTGSHVRATSPTLTTPTVATSLTASYATASTAAAFDGSKNLVSATITGSGNAVYSASPTLTGTISAAAISASGNVTADSLISSKFYTEGSFTATLTGCTTSPTVTVKYVRIGKAVTLDIPSVSATSSSSSATLTGLPAGLKPSGSYQTMMVGVYDNGNAKAGGIQISAGDGTMSLTINTGTTYSTNGFTTSGTKGLPFDHAITYTLY